MTILLSDPRVSAVPVRDLDEPLVRLDAGLSPSRQLVRRGLAERLAAADAALPLGIGLLVVEGHRPVAAQHAIVASYSAVVRAHRTLLATVLGEVGLVNYPTEWWHWSFGDRYWALATGASHALYGPVDVTVAA